MRPQDAALLAALLVTSAVGGTGRGVTKRSAQETSESGITSGDHGSPAPAQGAGQMSAGAAPEWLGPPLRQPPSRIVTLAPSLTELVISLGARDRLVGVSRYDTAAEVQTWYQADPNNRSGVDPTLSSIGYPGDADNN